MPLSFTFTMSALPDVAMTRQELADAIAAGIVVAVSGAPGFVEGGPQPTTDQGPWHPPGANYWEFWDPTATTYLPSPPVPTGTVAMFAAGPTGTGSLPAGWLLCDGNAYAQGSYQALFSVIGFNYCFRASDNTPTADHTTLAAANQFRVPDFRGRFPLGAGTGTSNFTGGSTPLTPRSIGERKGAESVIISPADLPTLTLPVFDNLAGTVQGAASLYGGYTYDPATGRNIAVPNPGGTGTGNMPPWESISFIIRT